jgi:hypothetical protein
MRTSWRERLTTALLVVVVAVPVGIVIGGGLDLGGPDEAVVDAATAPTGPATTTTTSAPTSTSTTAPATTTTVAGRPASEVRVLFANGSRTAGAAVTVGRRLEPLGYVVLRPAPSPPEPLAATAIFHREGFAAEAAAVARDLGLAGVGPAPFPPVPEIAGAATADVVVIVADDAVAAAGAAPAG